MPTEPPPPGNVVRLPNERLRQAMISAGITTKALARKTGVHPRTVQRWLDYHRPPKDRDLREQVAKLLAVDSEYLWPSSAAPQPVDDELAGYYRAVHEIPAEVWNALLYGSDDVAILTDDPVLIVGEMRAFLPALVMRAAARHRVRIMIRDPDDPQLDRDDPLIDNVRQLIDQVHRFADVRLHRQTLGQSIFAFGDEMIVVLHTGADTAGEEPALHLRLSDDSRHQHHAGVRRDALGGFATYTRAFRRAWERPIPANPVSKHPELVDLATKGPPPGVSIEEHLVRTEAFLELTQRFNQIREALLDLDPEPEIRLRLDQILTALDWFNPDGPILTPAEIAEALHQPMTPLPPPGTRPGLEAVPDLRDPKQPDQDEQ